MGFNFVFKVAASPFFSRVDIENEGGGGCELRLRLSTKSDGDLRQTKVWL